MSALPRKRTSPIEPVKSGPLPSFVLLFSVLGALDQLKAKLGGGAYYSKFLIKPVLGGATYLRRRTGRWLGRLGPDLCRKKGMYIARRYFENR
jgi:hypothetical protein